MRRIFLFALVCGFSAQFIEGRDTFYSTNEGGSYQLFGIKASPGIIFFSYAKEFRSTYFAGFFFYSFIIAVRSVSRFASLRIVFNQSQCVPYLD